MFQRVWILIYIEIRCWQITSVLPIKINCYLFSDLANPKTNTKSAGFTPQEREGMTQLLKEGFVDTFRKLYPDKTGAYSFWTYLQNARSRNVGWYISHSLLWNLLKMLCFEFILYDIFVEFFYRRLDYFITSERFFPSVCDNVIRSEVYGSDHCPITLFAHMEWYSNCISNQEKCNLWPPQIVPSIITQHSSYFRSQLCLLFWLFHFKSLYSWYSL